MKKINVIGAGLAGSEAAYFLATHNYLVNLYEMRPSNNALAHHSDKCGELVCSNSLKSSSIENAAGLLKKEMEVMGSLVIESAYKNFVPAGQALAVDREEFSNYINDKIKTHPNINFIHEEINELNDDEIYIICTGPLTSPSFSKFLSDKFGQDYLYFYDAAAPLIKKDSIDFNKAYYKSRYDKGDGKDYINCPFNKEEFDTFYKELIMAKRAPLHNFEKEIHFEGCMPIESIGARGPKTLLFGPLKPVGLEKDGIRPYGVVQLRRDNKMDDIYNIVGFQTNLLFEEQKRVFRMIPGLENVEFVRYGVMHRNTFINSPKLINSTLQFRQFPNIFIAGQICGVEGYIESAATGIIAAINAIRYLNNLDLLTPPSSTIIGSLLNYISSATNLQPMNANYGVLLTTLKDKTEIYEKSINDLNKWFKDLCL